MNLAVDITHTAGEWITLQFISVWSYLIIFFFLAKGCTGCTECPRRSLCACQLFIEKGKVLCPPAWHCLPWDTGVQWGSLSFAGSLLLPPAHAVLELLDLRSEWVVQTLGMVRVVWVISESAMGSLPGPTDQQSAKTPVSNQPGPTWSSAKLFKALFGPVTKFQNP